MITEQYLIETAHFLRLSILCLKYLSFMPNWKRDLNKYLKTELYF